MTIGIAIILAMILYLIDRNQVSSTINGRRVSLIILSS